MTTLESDRLWAHYQLLKAEPEPLENPGQVYSDWFQQRCREGRDPSALARYSMDLDEKIEARSLPGVGGCLIWDGPFDSRGIPFVRHVVDGREFSIRIRRHLLKRAGVPEQPRKRVVSKCSQRACVNVNHLVYEDESWAVRTRDETIYGRLQALALRLGHTPSSVEWERSGLAPKRKSLGMRYGSWTALIKRASLPPVNPRRARRSMLLNEVREFVKSGGRHMRQWDAEDHSRSSTTVGRYFGSWAVALRKAGLRD